MREFVTEYSSTACITEHGHVFRMELLTTAPDQNDLLILLVNITDLLVSCCEGKNPFIESICQTIFSQEELLKVCLQLVDILDLLLIVTRVF